MISNKLFSINTTKLIVECNRFSKIWVTAVKPKLPVQAKLMKKVLRTTETKRKFYKHDDGVPVPFKLSYQHVKKTQPMRRIAVLNKLFMRNITESLALSRIYKHLEGNGFEVTGVSISPDFSIVNVYWYCSAEECDDIASLLDKEAHNIRHDLTQLHLMGCVPRIKFFRDKNSSQKSQMEHLFNVADYGPENEEDMIVEPSVEEELPPMGSEVFGLKHSKIMEKVKQKMYKSRAVHRNTEKLVC